MRSTYRLGHAGNSEQGIFAHIGAVVAQLAHMRVVHRLTFAGDQHLRVGQLAVVDVIGLQEFIDPGQPRRVEAMPGSICQFHSKLSHQGVFCAHTVFLESIV